MVTLQDNLKKFPKFQERMSIAMSKNGMSIVTLAAKAEVDASTLSRYMSGKRLPEVATLYTLANYLHVSMEWLLGKTDDPTPPGNTQTHSHGKTPAPPPGLNEDDMEIAVLYHNAPPAERRIVNKILEQYQPDNVGKTQDWKKR